MKSNRLVEEAMPGFSRLSRREMLKLIAAAGVSSFLPLRSVFAAPQALPALPIIVFIPPAASTHSALLVKAGEFDRKRGLNLVYHYRGDLSAFYNDFAAGVVPVNLAGGTAVWSNMYTQGVKLKIVMAPTIFKHYIAVPADSGIRGFADLKGKRLAWDRASFSYAWLLRIAREHGLDAERDITVVQSGVGQLMPTLAVGNADATWVPAGNFESFFEQNPGKFRLLLSLDDELARILKVKAIYSPLTAALQSYLAAREDVFETMFLVWRDMAEWFSKNTATAIDLLARPFEQGGSGLSRAVVQSQLTALKSINITAIPAPEAEESLFKELEAYREVGYIKSVPDRGIIWQGLRKYAR